MTHEYDGSTLDLEKRLVRYMVERRISRRQLLDRIAKVGAAAALGPVIAACTGSSSQAPSSGPSTGPSTGPTPEPELYVYNWLDYIGDDVLASFKDKYPTIDLHYELFDDIYTAYEKLGADGNGYDLSFPVSVDVPAFREAGTLRKLDLSLLPNLVNLGAEWANPGYDPGNQYSVPYVWWTTGVGYDPTKVTDNPTSSTALWDPRYDQHIAMMDDYQEVFGLTLIQLGHSANSTDTDHMDAALARLTEGKPLVRTWSNDTIGTMSGGDVWIGMIWGSDVYQISLENPNIAYYIPEEGAVRGSDTMAIYSGAKHPIAAHLFINHLLDAQVSAANTNAIGYMGPNAAAREFIDPEILGDPAVNPDQAILDKLEELLDLPNAVDDEYLNRWQEYRGG